MLETPKRIRASGLLNLEGVDKMFTVSVETSDGRVGRISDAKDEGIIRRVAHRENIELRCDGHTFGFN